MVQIAQSTAVEVGSLDEMLHTFRFSFEYLLYFKSTKYVLGRPFSTSSRTSSCPSFFSLVLCQHGAPPSPLTRARTCRSASLYVWGEIKRGKAGWVGARLWRRGSKGTEVSQSEPTPVLIFHLSHYACSIGSIRIQNKTHTRTRKQNRKKKYKKRCRLSFSPHPVFTCPLRLAGASVCRSFHASPYPRPPAYLSHLLHQV